MTDEPVKTATKKALSVAKEAGCMITFDPNLRPPLWKTLDEAKEQMEYGFENCDVLKISDNEIQFVIRRRRFMIKELSIFRRNIRYRLSS